jgi:RhtB (resistance to homoserine/threonine) family protein
VDRELGRERVHRANDFELRSLTPGMNVDFLPFLAISVLLIVMPGPDTAVVTKNALMGGRRSGVYCALGVALGLTVWTIAAALGVAALLQASAVAFFALKIAGALYLIWIGIQMLRARDPATAATAVGHGVAPHARGAKALRQGLLSDLANPKIAVFFTSFLPQFVHGDGPVFAPLLMLGLVFAVLTLAWLAAYGAAVGRASGVLRRPSVRRTLDRITGVVLIAFGIRLAFERR